MSNDNDSRDDNVDLSRRGVLGGALGTGAALATLGAGMGVSSSALAAGKHDSHLPDHPKYNFTFVNHVTTNPFFVPTQYGAADACAAFGCSYQWTGSRKSKPREMVNAMMSAIGSGTDGIAVALVDQQAFDDPINRALEAGIPVVSYNADDTTSNNRMAYIGQGLYLAGKALGERIVKLVGSGDVVGFIATPGQLNIQPRMDGARDAIKESGADIRLHQIASGPTVNEEFKRIESFYLGHKNVAGMFAVDAGSTAGVANTMMKHDLDIPAGGFDLLPTTLDAINKGALNFTIDQQPYLQGFYPVMELFLWQISGGLTGMSNINTGLKFITQDSVKPYLSTKSRYEGNSSEVKNLPAPDSIAT